MLWIAYDLAALSVVFRALAYRPPERVLPPLAGLTADADIRR
jgi:hypothetical protein